MVRALATLTACASPEQDVLGRIGYKPSGCTWSARVRASRLGQNDASLYRTFSGVNVAVVRCVPGWRRSDKIWSGIAAE